MKVALLIGGYTRTFELNIESLKEKILSKFDNVDIYLHLTKDEINEDKYLNNIRNVNQIKFTYHLTQKWIKVNFYLKMMVMFVIFLLLVIVVQ